MQEQEREALRTSIELLHNCRARFLRSEQVRVTAGSVTIEREVAVFALEGHSAPAQLAYAWSDRLSAERGGKHQVVLHRGVVKSAQLAVAGFYLSENAT